MRSAAYPSDPHYSATAKWWTRDDTPATLADCWIDLIQRLRQVDQSLAEWYEWEDDNYVAIRADMERAARFIEAGVLHNDDGTPEPYYGYQHTAHNTTRNISPDRLTLHMLAGGRSDIATNFVGLDTDIGLNADPTVLTYEIFRGVTLALAESFDAIQAAAFPTRILDLLPSSRGRASTLTPSWISYIGPRHAHLVTPPRTAFVEHRPDGGLLMAAADETFVTANPAHLAVARDIEAAIAPFNAQIAAEHEVRLAKARRMWAEAATRRAAGARTGSQ